MTDIETVVREFVDANPAPVPAALHRSRPEVDEMLSAAKRSGSGLGTAEPRVRVGRGWMVAIASFLVVLGFGAALSWLMGTSTEETPDPIGQLERDAVATAEQWLDAANRGDVSRVMALSGPTARNIADQRMYEWLAGLAAEGMPVDVIACASLGATEQAATVECQVRLGDRVAVELGMSEVIAPFIYSEGLLSWQPYRGADISRVNRAYSTFLRLFHTVEYEQNCLTSAYEPGTVVQSAGLTLTGECAALAAPLADDVVQWIRDGRPTPDE